jgi:hypothetical protein
VATAILGRELLAAAGLFQDVVHVSDGQPGMGRLLPLAMGVERFAASFYQNR